MAASKGNGGTETQVLIAGAGPAGLRLGLTSGNSPKRHAPVWLIQPGSEPLIAHMTSVMGGS